MVEKGSKKIIIILIAIILVLLAVLAYLFLIRPQINGYVIQKQIEAKDIVLNALLTQLQQQGYVQISNAQGNSIVLVPAPQQPQQQPPQQAVQ